MNIRGFALFFLLLVQHEMILCHKMEFCANKPRVFCHFLYAFHFSLSHPLHENCTPHRKPRLTISCTYLPFRYKCSCWKYPKNITNLCHIFLESLLLLVMIMMRTPPMIHTLKMIICLLVGRSFPAS